MPRKTVTGPPVIGAPHVASMRPRPDAAENPQVARGVSGSTSRFNEAAARCRGKPSTAGAHGPRSAKLQ